jgi:hypothetical protein
MPEAFDMRPIQRGARLPSYNDDPFNEYWHLLNEVTLWDVSVERNTEITGVDAFRFTSLLTPRDLSNRAVGHGKYVLIAAEDGGMVNDPVLLRLGERHFEAGGAGAVRRHGSERHSGGSHAHRMDERGRLRDLPAGWQPRRRVVGTHHGGGASFQYPAYRAKRYSPHRRRHTYEAGLDRCARRA